MRGTILKITGFPDTHSKECPSGDRDPKDVLLKTRFDRPFRLSQGEHMGHKMTKGGEETKLLIFLKKTVKIIVVDRKK